MGESAFAPAPLEFGVLGPFEATCAGSLLPLGGRQQRAVLARLVSEVGHTVSVERLVSAVWGESPPAGAVTSLQTYVFHLRQVLEPARARGSAGTVLVTVPGGYRLEVDAERVDATRFEGLVARGAALAREPALAIRAYEDALALWRGDVLADLADCDFVAPVRARLEELRATVLQSRIQAELDLGRHAAVVAELGPLIADHPLREGFHAQRILALYRSGRQSDALAAYRELRSLLDSELGIEPSPPLRELNNRVLAQDPALAWQPPAGSAVSVARATGPPAGQAPHTGGRASHAIPFRAWHRRVPLRTVLGIAAVGAVAAVLAVGVGMRPWAGPDPAGRVAANAVTQLGPSGSVLASIPVGTNPVALASGRGALWVVNADDDTVSKIDPTTHAVQAVLDVGRKPQALAVTGDDLWVANFADGTLSRVNLVASRVVDTIRVGSGPAALAAGPAGLWVANSGDNTIQRIHPVSGAVGAPIDVGDGPDGLAVDHDSVWVANGRAGSISRVDGYTGEQLFAPIRVGSGPRGIVRAGADVYVADELSQSVTRINVPTRRTHSIDVGDGPTALAVHDGAVWVAERYSGDLLRIDLRTERKSRIAAHAAVRGLAVIEGRMWVASGAIASAAHQGGILRVAAGALPGHVSGLDPANVYDRTALHAERVVYDGLLAYHYTIADPQTVVPDLATSVPDPTDGGRTYTFNLRPGIRYSTGAPVKASDLVRGVRRALRATSARPDFYAGIRGGQACIDDKRSCDLSKGVVADDARGLVTFHLNAPDPQFLYKLTILVVPTPAGTPLGRLRSPLPGTGPYRIASYTRDKKLILARNKFFQEWSAGAQPAGFVDTVTWLKVSDAREAADAVRRGRADLAELTPLGEESTAVGSLVDELRIAAPSLLHSALTQATSFGVLNSSRAPFDKPRARQAFNYAVDRRRAVAIMGGPSVAVATCQLLPPSVPSYAPYCPYTRGSADGKYRGPDLSRARRLVKASGTYGTKVTVTDVVGDYNPPLDSYFVRVLRSIGYRATLHRIPDNARNERAFYDPGSRIQVESGGWIADFPMPSNFYDVVSCAGAGYPTSYCNRRLDQQAAAATAMLQSDPGAALRTWTSINRDVTDQAALVPMTNYVNWWITSKRVGDYQGGGREIGPLMSQLWVR